MTDGGIDDFSRTVAEAWIVLQVAYRHNLGVNVDCKTAQREGESIPCFVTWLFFFFFFPSLLLFFFFTARQGALDALEDATGN